MDLQDWMNWTTGWLEGALAHEWLVPLVLGAWAVGVTAAAVLLWRRQRRLVGRFDRLFRGDEQEDLETVMRSVAAHLEGHDGQLQSLGRRMERLEVREERSLNYAGLVRYDAFDDAGGEQSFSLALVNEQRDGLVISSLFGRSENRIYAKPIRRGESSYILSDEERQALQKAFRAAERQERAGEPVNYR